MIQQAFDIATSSFGLFFLEDMVKCLTNIASTVKPGGKIAITKTTGPDSAKTISINRPYGTVTWLL